MVFPQVAAAPSLIFCSARVTAHIAYTLRVLRYCLAYGVLYSSFFADEQYWHPDVL